MKNETPLWAALAGATILILIFGTLALVAAGGWTWFSTLLLAMANNASGWVQAVFSFGAIFGAVWIYRGEAQERKEQAAIAAELAGAAIVRQLTEIAMGAERVAFLFSHMARFDGPSEKFKELLDHLLLAPQLDKSTLVDLHPVPGRSARKLAQAISIIDHCTRSLKGNVESSRKFSMQHRKMLAAYYARELETARLLVVNAQEYLVAFLNETAPQGEQLGPPIPLTPLVR